MSWTRSADIRAQVQKLWDRGEILAAGVTGEPLFPRRLPLKTPTSAEIADRFAEVRAWVDEIRAIPCCRVELREFRHRLYGANTLPHAVWLDTAGDAAAFIGKQRAVARFAGLLETTRMLEPRLAPWLAKRPLRALELVEEWRRLLAIVAWIEQHPASGLYLRQVDLPGVHSKFIEAHRGVLAELLDLVLHPEAIDATATGSSRFAQRYGFLDKPTLVRFRPLDPRVTLLQSSGFPRDITLDAESFARLDPPVSRVFITENEINFLALPRMEESLAIFGAGYGFAMLEAAEWLKRCRIHYWGDIDTHGFAILNQLRLHFTHVESFLMDRVTLLAFEARWGEEEKQTVRDLAGLNREEQSLYDDLRDNRIRKKLRLEQEKIGFGWVESALAGILNVASPLVGG